jgi:2-polyprenyl-3-methyl-5-hydroxy-6-metoxy-1,4-benzoquinol methylase
VTPDSACTPPSGSRPAHRPVAAEQAELDAIAAHIPRRDHSRVLDIGCGIGRIAGPLATRGYTVTGVDVSVAALSVARERAPGPWYVAIDQRHIGHMRWEFDAVLVIWNSLGFVDRAADLETVAGVARVLRPGGKVLFDMYHSTGWLRSARNDRGCWPSYVSTCYDPAITGERVGRTGGR